MYHNRRRRDLRAVVWGLSATWIGFVIFGLAQYFLNDVFLTEESDMRSILLFFLAPLSLFGFGTIAGSLYTDKIDRMKQESNWNYDVKWKKALLIEACILILTNGTAAVLLYILYRLDAAHVH